MRFVTILVVFCVVTGIAAAEVPSGKVEVTVHSGFSFLDAETSFNSCPFCLSVINPVSTVAMRNSMMFGFKGGYYFNRSMEIEGGFAVSPGHRLDQTGFSVCIPELPCPAIEFFPYFNDTRAVVYQYDGNLVYNLEAGSANPFFTFGIGGVSTVRNEQTDHDFSFNFGGGAKFYFRRAGIRIEVNDRVIPDHFLSGKTEYNVQVQYGFVFRLS